MACSLVEYKEAHIGFDRAPGSSPAGRARILGLIPALIGNEQIAIDLDELSNRCATSFATTFEHAQNVVKTLLWSH